MSTDFPERTTPEPPKPASWPARLWRWIRLAVVLGMVAGLVVKAGPARLGSALAAAAWLWVLAAVPFTFCAVSLDALKLYWLVKPIGFTGGWRSVFRTTIVVNFVSLFLPGTVGGGAVAWYRLSRPDNLRAQTFVALSLNAALKIVALCAVGAAALAFDVHAAQSHRALLGPLALLAALPLLVLVLMLTTGLTSAVKRIHANSFSRVMPVRLHDALRKILESLETYRSSPSSVMGALAANILRLLVAVCCPLFCLYAVGVTEVSFLRLLWVMSAVEAAGMIPFSLSGWGLPQVAFVGLLAAFGIPENLSLASNVIAWVAWLPVYLAGAGVMLRESSRAARG